MERRVDDQLRNLYPVSTVAVQLRNSERNEIASDVTGRRRRNRNKCVAEGKSFQSKAIRLAQRGIYVHQLHKATGRSSVIKSMVNIKRP